MDFLVFTMGALPVEYMAVLYQMHVCTPARMHFPLFDHALVLTTTWRKPLASRAHKIYANRKETTQKDCIHINLIESKQTGQVVCTDATRHRGAGRTRKTHTQQLYYCCSFFVADIHAHTLNR